MIRPFIKIEVEDRHGIYIVRVGNWRLVKDMETGQGEWQWIGKEKGESEVGMVQNHMNLLARNV